MLKVSVSSISTNPAWSEGHCIEAERWLNVGVMSPFLAHSLDRTPAPFEVERGYLKQSEALLNAACVKAAQNDLQERTSTTTATTSSKGSCCAIELTVEAHFVLDHQWDSESMGTLTGGVAICQERRGCGRRKTRVAEDAPTGVEQPQRAALIRLCPKVELKHKGVEQHQEIGVKDILADAEKETKNAERFRGAKFTRSEHVGLADALAGLRTNIREEVSRKVVYGCRRCECHLIVQGRILHIHFVLDVRLGVECGYDGCRVVISVHLVCVFLLIEISRTRLFKTPAHRGYRLTQPRHLWEPRQAWEGEASAWKERPP